jgi:iron(III) transport system ATP-binding protein
VGVDIRNVALSFGATQVLRNINLSVEPGEFFALLGPSGSGKSTLLRLIAGFNQHQHGEVLIGGKDVTGIPPWERNVGMVFQNYALWPHMTVYENAAYGLRLRKIPAAEIDQRIRAVLDKVKLGGLEDRYPGQLSGGQQQRVALARALVLNPKILLLDEPLSNLDAKIRIQVRAEIRKLQRELGITTVYVTHDQEEALALSDRIAVFNKGRMLQLGPPKALYERPESRFVADFIGINNLIDGTVEAVDAAQGLLRVRTALGEMAAVLDERRRPGERCIVAVRPENADFDGAPVPGRNYVQGQITFAAYLGNTLRYDVDVGQGMIFKVDVRDPWHHEQLAMGAPVTVTFAATSTVAMAAEQ